MIAVEFSYNLDESKNWEKLYTILPLKDSTEEDVKNIIAEIVKVKNKNVPYREFSYRIDNRKDIN